MPSGAHARLQARRFSGGSWARWWRGGGTGGKGGDGDGVPPGPLYPVRPTRVSVGATGYQYDDPYAWLASPEHASEARALLAREAARYEARAAAWAPLQRRLAEEISAHAEAAARAEQAPPERCGEWLYYFGEDGDSGSGGGGGRGRGGGGGGGAGLMRRHAETGAVQAVLTDAMVAADARALSRRFGREVAGEREGEEEEGGGRATEVLVSAQG